MVKNVGTADRVARLVVALALFSLVFLLDGAIRWLGLFGLVPLATALAANCPAYTLFHLDTRRHA